MTNVKRKPTVAPAKLPDRRWKIDLNSEEAFEELKRRTSIEAEYDRKLLHVVDMIRANKRYPHCTEAIRQWRDIAHVMRDYIRKRVPWGEIEREYQKALRVYWETNARYTAPLARKGENRRRDARKGSKETNLKKTNDADAWKRKILKEVKRLLRAGLTNTNIAMRVLPDTATDNRKKPRGMSCVRAFIAEVRAGRYPS